jgi:FAD/FMN-containing dehydrogenase
MSEAALVADLKRIAGDSAVRTDDEALALVASDVHETGCRPAAVVRPVSSEQMAQCVAAATGAGYAIAPRGGGLSYTAGYIPGSSRTICMDTGGLDRIVDISPEDMTITVQAGVTWKQIFDALKPLNLRLPFFGTFSGKGATVGGGLSHGALFFGSARYGSAAENVLGLEVACADGSLLSTGQAALEVQSKPFLRSFGPDLTGLFVHDGGTLGVKTAASFRLIVCPPAEAFASFSFADFETASAVLSQIAREELAEEVYILDPASTDHLDVGMAAKLRTARAVAGVARGPVKALKSLLGMLAGGSDFIPKGHYSLHLTAAGRSEAGIRTDLARAHEMARKAGGKVVAATIPMVVRAELFANLNGVLGPEGGRWAALNAKVAHSDAIKLITAFDETMAPYREAMTQNGVSITRLASALSNHSFSFEPVFHWADEWLPIHRVSADPDFLSRFEEPQANPVARELVNRLRAETVELFRRHGVASNQIGRTYPYLSALSEKPSALLVALKRHLDPAGLMNPGVLGFSQTHKGEQMP